MSQDIHKEHNVRLAKNTLMLYVRMVFLMVIGLYTSRVVLQSLGEEDFGIYNVVGGLVSMFSLISASLSSSISRFITYELGSGQESRLTSVFSSAVLIQIILACVVVAVAEPLGLWFIEHKMNIPIERIGIAKWVFQFSLLTFIVNLISIPYNALIIAHEKMAAFAYIGIFEGLGKLAVAFMIVKSSGDRLILYAVLMSVVAIAVLQEAFPFMQIERKRGEGTFETDVFICRLELHRHNFCHPERSRKQYSGEHLFRPCGQCSTWRRASAQWCSSELRYQLYDCNKSADNKILCF